LPVVATVVVVVAIGLVVAALSGSLWWGHGTAKDASRVHGFETVAFSVRDGSAPPPGSAAPGSAAPGSAAPRSAAPRSAAPDVSSSAIIERCALLANTEAQRGRGLMHRRDLGGYDAMVFLWPAPTTEAFYMKDTLIPLSVAWFDQASHFVSETDMAPCPPGTACPLFSAAAPYTIAVEVPAGGLAGLGIGPGSTIALGGACR
jgi:uncharacterized membrane protein (UPF0127 family)